MIRFACPHCGGKCKAPFEAVGRRGRCMKCGASLSVPGPPVRTPDVTVRPAARVDDAPIMAEAIETVEPSRPPANPSIPVRSIDGGRQRPRRVSPSINVQACVAGVTLVALGICAAVVGVAVLRHFFFVFDTSVPVDDFGWRGFGTGPPARVVNLGLMQDRQIGIWVGLGVTAAGLITALFGVSLWARSFDRNTR
jgi:hypothetical protein